MVSKGNWLNGRDALAELDSEVLKLRGSLSAALSDADSLESRRAAIQKEQAAAYGALAALRLDLMQAGEKAEFAPLEAKAQALTERHEAFVAAQQTALDEAAGVLKQLEDRRADLAARHDAAIAAYETKVAETEAALKQSAAYAGLVQAAEEARAVVLRAQQKLELARQDRTEKGAPYEQDPLFSYLWKRRFRSPEYKAGGIIRLLDSWVARTCRYDQAFLNYQRLTELPERIAEHVTFVGELEEQAEAALVAAEQAALEEAGTGALQQAAVDLKTEIAACDAGITAAEEEHRERAQQHEAALKEEAGPAVEARLLLAEELRKASFPDLRLLAAETVALEDDRLVDELVRLRAEQMSLDLEAGKRLARPKVLRSDLELLEALRRGFKDARFDSPYAVMPRAAFEQMLADLVRGGKAPRDALRGLSRSVKRAESQSHPDFGGQGRRDTIGLPDIMGGVIGGVLAEVLEEVIEETTRGGSRHGSGPIFPGPPKRMSRPPKIGGGRSFPSRGGSRKGGGGFKTGGGF